MMRFAFAVLVAAAIIGSANAQSPVERGGYLVNGILTCGNCHTPKGPGGVELTAQMHAGGVIEWDTPTFKLKGPNIPSDGDTGIGAWSDADIKRAIQEGRRPNATPLAPIMPFAFYKVFTPGDLDAVVAYLKSVPAVHNQTQPPV